MRINLNIDGCGVVAPPVHSSLRAPHLLGAGASEAPGKTWPGSRFNFEAKFIGMIVTVPNLNSE